MTLPATTSAHIPLISSCTWTSSSDIPGHPFNIALNQSEGERPSLYERDRSNLSASSWSVSTDEDRDEPLDIETIEDWRKHFIITRIKMSYIQLNYYCNTICCDILMWHDVNYEKYMDDILFKGFLFSLAFKFFFCTYLTYVCFYLISGVVWIE